MKINQLGLDLIKKSEGLSLKAYVCPAGVLTIGYGATKNVRDGQKITLQEAEDLLQADLDIFEEGVYKMTKTAGLNANQYSALVSFAYNLGLTALKNSTLLKKVLANPNDPNIEHQFRKWVYAGGKILKGLIIRRDAEATLYFTPVEAKPKSK